MEEKPRVHRRNSPNWKVVIRCSNGKEFLRGRLYAAQAWEYYKMVRKYPGVVEVFLCVAGKPVMRWRSDRATFG